MKFEIGPIKFDSDKFKVKREERKAKREEIKSKKPKREFSKMILVTAWLSGSAVILFACYLTYMMVMHGHEGNVELIAIILTGGFAEISLGTSFYYWKSKNENMQKIGNNVGGQDHEEY